MLTATRLRGRTNGALRRLADSLLTSTAPDAADAAQNLAACVGEMRARGVAVPRRLAEAEATWCANALDAKSGSGSWPQDASEYVSANHTSGWADLGVQERIECWADGLSLYSAEKARVESVTEAVRWFDARGNRYAVAALRNGCLDAIA